VVLYSTIGGMWSLTLTDIVQFLIMTVGLVFLLTIGTVRLGYVHGISGFWLCGAIGLGIVGLSLFLAKPLLKLKIYTVTQVLERRYNPAARTPAP
ncbi:hypothetical protein ACXKGW_28980, partial [Klebsiella pneumoniae subsp. pneumoniae]